MGGRNVEEDEIEEEEEDEREVLEGDAGDGGERDDDEDEDDDEEGKNEYEQDGFIVDDEEEPGEEDEERASSDEEKQKKKKRKKKKSEMNYVVDEDDYQLLQENDVGGVHGPKLGSKKLKRLNKAGQDEAGPSGIYDDEVLDRSGRTAEEKPERSLFGDDEAPHVEDEEEQQDEEEEEPEISEDDDMDDFIVTEDDFVENGDPVRLRRSNKNKSRHRLEDRKKQIGGFSNSRDREDLRLEDEKDNKICDIDVPERIWVLWGRYDSLRKRDPYYKPDESSLQNEKEKDLTKKHFKPRMIVHPRFQNITADEAIELLSDKEAGECIIRPSSRGSAFLTLTVKVYDGVYAHKDIIEGGKDHKDVTSSFRLGKTLKIGNDTFEGLDEVMDRYVDPLVAHLKSMLSYRKFKRGSKAEVDDLLRVEKYDYPTRIVYCFGISHEHPGSFILSYIRSTDPHHEYVGLYPKGFKFRKQNFEDIDRLVDYFKEHFDVKQHDSGPSIRSVAAMVLKEIPANGGSSGGGNEPNWDQDPRNLKMAE